MSVVDSTALDRLRKLGGDALIRRLIDLFSSHAGSKLEEARASLQNEDLESFKRAVHSIKSSAGNVGAVKLYEVSGKFEQMASQGNWGVIRSAFGELEDAFQQAKSRLEEERKGLGDEEGCDNRRQP